jgi:hypothetical protein
MMEEQPARLPAWMISPRFPPIATMHAFGVDDDDASPIQVLFPIPFLEWVTSAKRYRGTFA